MDEIKQLFPVSLKKFEVVTVDYPSWIQLGAHEKKRVSSPMLQSVAMYSVMILLMLKTYNVTTTYSYCTGKVVCIKGGVVYYIRKNFM